MASGLHRLKFWAAQNANAEPSPQADPNIQTVAQATAHMNGAQRDAWLKTQITKVSEDMRAKGLEVDDSKVGHSGFIKHIDSGVTPLGHDIRLNPRDFDTLTVAEFRTILAHEIEHTQRMDMLLSYPIAAEIMSDQAAVRTYGASLFNSALEKSLNAAVKHHSMRPDQLVNDYRQLPENDPNFDPHAPIGIRKQDNINYEKTLQAPSAGNNFQKQKPSSLLQPLMAP